MAFAIHNHSNDNRSGQDKDPAPAMGPAEDGMALQFNPGMTHHGDAAPRPFGATGMVLWFDGELISIRGNFPVLVFHKPFQVFKFLNKEQREQKYDHFFRGRYFREDAIKYGFLLPGIIPLQWRGMCVKSEDLNHGVKDLGSYNRYRCMNQHCKCPHEDKCYYDDLCPAGEPWKGLGCYKDSNGRTCRECGYGNFSKISCARGPLLALPTASA